MEVVSEVELDGRHRVQVPGLDPSIDPFSQFSTLNKRITNCTELWRQSPVGWASSPEVLSSGTFL